MEATGFEAAPVTFHGLDAVRLSCRDAGAEAVVALEGGTLLRWRATLRGRPVELVDGYRDAAELAGQDGVRNGVMVPFVNRIAGGRYRFDGRDHDLLPGRTGSRVVYHGVLRRLRTAVTRLAAAPSRAEVELTASIRPGQVAGYPFALDVAVRYLLTESALRLEITGSNGGDRDMPYAAGWHPYFTLGADGPVDGLELLVPASTVIRTGDDLLPLPGAAAFVPAAQLPGLDFGHGRPIGGSVLDVAFADLAADPAGWSTTVLRNPSSGAQLRVRQQGGLMHVFTGDTLARDARRSIALEPVEVMTDAFNRPDCRDRITLRPGRSRTFRCEVAVA
jgi:aldose 1-epimerase